MGERRDAYRVLVGKPEGPRHGSSGSGMWCYGLNQAGSGYGQEAGTSEHGKETLGSIKCREFLY